MKEYFAKSRVLIYLLTALLVLFLHGSVTAGSSSPTFYYFNPDSAHSNLARLNQAMDEFLLNMKTARKIDLAIQKTALDFVQNIID